MNPIFVFFIEVIATFMVCAATFRYLRPFLNRILVDLCGSEERAQFWTIFSSILLLGIPLLFGFMYRPQAQGVEDMFFELTHRISGNLVGFIFGLIGVGFIISFFTLVTPRTKETK